VLGVDAEDIDIEPAEAEGGGRDPGTARPGGRLKRVAGGRRRAVLVRLSATEEEWLVPKAAALGISVQRLLVESAMGGGPASVLARRTVYDELLAARRDVLGVAVNINQLARWGNEHARMPAGVAASLQRFEAAQARLTELAERVVGQLTGAAGGTGGGGSG
jgi:hypothetical protein